MNIKKVLQDYISYHWIEEFITDEQKDAMLKNLGVYIKGMIPQLTIHSVINWVACKDVKPINGKEYLISDSEDVTEAQWYDDSKWGGEPYDSYTHYAEKPKPPCL
jgi:hypothetical protein